MNSEQLKNRLAIARDIVFIFALVLFFAGWLFAYFYFSYFGLALHSMDIPLFNYYFYSINVVLHAIYYSSPESLLLAAAIVVLFAVLFTYSPVLVSIGVVAVWFWVGFYVTRDAALNATTYIRSGLAPAIEFQFKMDQDLSSANMPDTSTPTCPDDGSEHVNRLCRGNLENRLFLIAQTDKYFVVFFRPEQPRETEVEPRGFVYHIPHSEVVAAVTLPQTLGGQDDTP